MLPISHLIKIASFLDLLQYIMVSIFKFNSCIFVQFLIKSRELLMDFHEKKLLILKKLHGGNWEEFLL